MSEQESKGSFCNENAESNGESRSTVPIDFESNIVCAAKDGKLSSVVFLLENGVNVNTKDNDVLDRKLIALLFFSLLKKVIEK